MCTKWTTVCRLQGTGQGTCGDWRCPSRSYRGPTRQVPSDSGKGLPQDFRARYTCLCPGFAHWSILQACSREAARGRSGSPSSMHLSMCTVLINNSPSTQSTLEAHGEHVRLRCAGRERQGAPPHASTPSPRRQALALDKPTYPECLLGIEREWHTVASPLSPGGI